MTWLDFLTALFNVFVFPGILFSVFFGCLFLWVYRKLRAKLQARIGPPWYQVFADVLKLMSKETIIPRRAWRLGFVAAPIIGLVGLLCSSQILPFTLKAYPLMFSGDLIVLLYLMTLPAIALVVAGASSGNPYGAVGAGREASLALWYELPLITSAVSVALASGSFRLWDITSYQALRGPFLVRLPCATIAALICLQAKLGRRPFDIPHAEAEIIAGPLTDYSGVLRGLFELSTAVEWLMAPALVTALFFGGPLTVWPVPGVVSFLLKCFGLVVLVSLVDVLNARFRIDQALKPLWGVAMPLSIFSLMRVLLGLGV